MGVVHVFALAVAISEEHKAKTLSCW